MPQKRWGRQQDNTLCSMGKGCVAHGLRQAHKAAFLWASKHSQVSFTGGPSPQQMDPKASAKSLQQLCKPKQGGEAKGQSKYLKGNNTNRLQA